MISSTKTFVLYFSFANLLIFSLKLSIFSFFIVRPAASSCPPYFCKISSQYERASNILKPETPLHEPFASSFSQEIRTQGFPYFSVILDATIPITP